MTNAANIWLIFNRAIRNQADSTIVRVRPEQLVTGFGLETAERLAGRKIDLQALEAAALRARQKVLDKLLAEQAELQQLQAAGIPDSRRELVELNKLIAKVQAGQLNAQHLVAVEVGQLREALATVEETLRDENPPSQE